MNPRHVHPRFSLPNINVEKGVLNNMMSANPGIEVALVLRE
jgi:hypothetical protein